MTTSRPLQPGFAERWGAALLEGGGQFAAVVLEAERTCRRILEDAESGPFEPDSVEHYAERIVRAIEATCSYIAANDADSAARAALDVGRLVTEASMKHRWERPALRGAKTAAALNKAASSTNRERSNEAERRYEEWQATAESLWTKNEYLSVASVAEIISKRTRIPASTIRHRIVRKVK